MLDELDLIDEDDQISHLVELVPEDGKPLNPELELSMTIHVYILLLFRYFQI